MAMVSAGLSVVVAPLRIQPTPVRERWQGWDGSTQEKSSADQDIARRLHLAPPTEPSGYC